MMSIWARLKKVYLMLAVIIMLLCVWPVADMPPPKMPPKPNIVIPESMLPQITSEYEENYYDIYINGELSEQSSLVLKDKNGNILIPPTALSSANIDVTNAKIIKYLDQNFVSLTSFPLITYELDLENLALKLTVPIDYFRYHVVDM